MYVQMMYYLIRPAFDKAIFNVASIGPFCELFVNILFCISIGIVLYFFDQKYVTGKLLVMLRGKGIIY